MRGLVLAGGAGVRLRPLTYTSAKQLIPIANRPILFYVLDDLARAGIREAAVVVAPETGAEIREAVGDGSAFGLDVTYVEQDAPRGLAHALLAAERALLGEPFVMYLGDNLLQAPIAPLAREFERERPAASILLSRVEHPEQFGVAEVRDGRVIRLVEKPSAPPSDLALVGVYLFDDRIFEAARQIRPSWRGELEITDAIQVLIDGGHDVRPHIVDGYWKDLGKLEDLLAGNRLVLESIPERLEGDVDPASRLEGRVVVCPGAKVVRSRIVGPAIVGRGALVVDSYVGPYTSIGDDCVVESGEVEHSILMSEARIVGVRRVIDSLLGRKATVERDGSSPVAYRLMLGDQSAVGIP